MADGVTVGAVLRRFTRAERFAIGLRLLAMWGAALGAGILLSGLLPWAGASRAYAALWVGLPTLAVAALGLGVAWRNWRNAGEPLRQARQVEAQHRDLRGLLVTLAAAPQVGASEALVARAQDRVGRRLAMVPGEVVHPLGTAYSTVSGAVVLTAVAAATWWLPPGPGARLAWWAAGAEGSVDPSVPAAASRTERVGDLVLRLTYPPYTGLPERVIENGTGDVEGPPGTTVDVDLRTGQAAEQAVLWLGDEALAATISGGRNVRGAFRIGTQSTTWHVAFSEPTGVSTTFQVISIPDRAPEVTVDAPANGLTVPFDAPIGLPWRAGDDYGVREVVLRIDGVEAAMGRRRVDGTHTVVEGSVSVRPAELDLQPGQEVVLEIVARDGDTVGGAHEGRSLPVRLRVGGPGASQHFRALREERLRDLLIPALAAFLVEAWPAGEHGGAIAAWGAAVGARYRPLFDELRRLGEDVPVTPLVGDVVESGTALIRFTQVAFDPDDRSAATPRVVSEAAVLRDEAVRDLEDALLMLELRARINALARVERSAQALGALGPDLVGRLDAVGATDAAHQATRAASRVHRDALRLQAGGLQDLIVRRLFEIDRLSDGLADAQDAEGRRILGQRLSARVIELAAAVAADLQRRREEGDEAARRALEVVDELEQLADDQEGLRNDVAARRKAARAGDEAALHRAWEEASAAAEALSKTTAGYQTELERAGRRFHETERAAGAADGAARARDAVTARDLRGATAAADGVLATTSVLSRLARLEAARAGAQGPDADEAARVQQAAGRLVEALSRLSAQSRAASAGSGTSDLSDEQASLGSRLQGAAAGARDVAQRMPVAPDGIERALEQARMRMGEATRDLQDSLALEAEGAQGSASQELRDAARLLRQALAAAQSGGSDGEGGEADGSTPSEGVVDLPAIEEFVPPEAYRQALLEAMRGEVPPAYRNARARYYQELVAP